MHWHDTASYQSEQTNSGFGDFAVYESHICQWVLLHSETPDAVTGSPYVRAGRSAENWLGLPAVKYAEVPPSYNRDCGHSMPFLDGWSHGRKPVLE